MFNNVILPEDYKWAIEKHGCKTILRSIGAIINPHLILTS